MNRYASKPVFISAIQLTQRVADAALEAGTGLPNGLLFKGIAGGRAEGKFVCLTASGEVEAAIGDWIHR